MKTSDPLLTNLVGEQRLAGVMQRVGLGADRGVVATELPHLLQ